jgi:hypothetical protein
MTQNIDKPDAQTPNSPGMFPSYFPTFIHDPSVKRDAFNELIQNRGIRFIHSKAYPCSNMKNLGDNNHDPLCPHCDGSGILYYDAREIFGAFSSNSIERQFEKQGAWELGTVVATFPTEYPDGVEADFSMFDKLEVTDFTVRLWELKEYETRTDLKQQLRYPIVKTSRVEAVNNSTRKEYLEGTDFNIEDGMIKWVSGRTPPEGQVYSVNYYCKPVYVVLNPLRELRITQELVDGQKVARRMPQQVVLRRDYFVNGPEKLK